MTDSPIDVLTVGHALVDVLSTSEDSFLEGEQLVKGSMLLIDDDRADQLYSRMGPANETSGGSAANTATGVVACGGTAAFIGTVAGDALGEIFTHDIRAAGVLYRTPPINDSIQTGRSMILVTPDGERTMNTNIGISGRVSMNHLDVDLLEAARITYVEGYLFDDNHPLEGWTDAVATLERAGNRFSVTLSDPFCVERHRSLFLNLVEQSVDICFGNEEEVCSLFQVGDLDTALDMIAKRCEIAAITRGAKGSIIVAGDKHYEIPAVPVTVVDTTGAGDFYAAGVLAGLAKGWDLEQCGQLGSKAASAIVSQLGARLSGTVTL